MIGDILFIVILFFVGLGITIVIMFKDELDFSYNLKLLLRKNQLNKLIKGNIYSFSRNKDFMDWGMLYRTLYGSKYAYCLKEIEIIIRYWIMIHMKNKEDIDIKTILIKYMDLYIGYNGDESLKLKFENYKENILTLQ